MSGSKSNMDETNSPPAPAPLPRIAVSVAARHPETGKFLLVLRARAPAKDLWAFPGGSVHFGETLAEAAQRELQEETGLRATDIRFQAMFELIDDGTKGDTPHHFLLAVHRAEATGEPVAADDAADAGWFAISEMERMPVTDSTIEVAEAIAEDAGVVPRDRITDGAQRNREPE